MQTGLYKAPRGQPTYTGGLIMQTMNPGDTATVQRIVSERKGRPGPPLEVLHPVQAASGYVPAVGFLYVASKAAPAGAPAGSAAPTTGAKA